MQGGLVRLLPRRRGRKGTFQTSLHAAVGPFRRRPKMRVRPRRLRHQGEGMFEKTQTAPALRPPSKEAILKQADGFRDLARRARRLMETMSDEGDRRRLTRYGEELDESAARLERAAVGAKTG
jgi:hypothetical protein